MPFSPAPVTGLAIVAQSLGSNGYRKYSDGSLEQWGQVAGSSTADTAVTFPIAFSAVPWSVIATLYGTAPAVGTFEGLSISTPTASGFTGYPRFTTGSTPGRDSSPWYWMARGPA